MTLSLALAPLTIRVFTTLQSDPRDLLPLRHLIRVMKRHDMTKKIDKDKYKDKDKDNDKVTYFYRTHSKRDPRDLWHLGHLIRVMRRDDLTKKNKLVKLREGVQKKTVFFRTLSQTMGRWGSKVLNFLVKITIQLFLLQTSRNVLKHILHKWGGHIWPFHDDLRPQKISTLTHWQQKPGFF